MGRKRKGGNDHKDRAALIALVSGLIGLVTAIIQLIREIQKP